MKFKNLESQEKWKEKNVSCARIIPRGLELLVGFFVLFVCVSWNPLLLF